MYFLDASNMYVDKYQSSPHLRYPTFSTTTVRRKSLFATYCQLLIPGKSVRYRFTKNDKKFMPGENFYYYRARYWETQNRRKQIFPSNTTTTTDERRHPPHYTGKSQETVSHPHLNLIDLFIPIHSFHSLNGSFMADHNTPTNPPH